MPDYYLQPQAVGLPTGLPDLKHNPQADGRLSIFAGETEEYRIWVEPKPVAWTKPGLYATESPTMQTGHQPDAGQMTHKPTNFGVNIQGLAAHRDRVETNDPGFMPHLQTANLSTAAGQQVPLPLGGDGPAAALPPYAGYGVAGLIVLAILFSRRKATVGS